MSFMSSILNWCNPSQYSLFSTTSHQPPTHGGVDRPAAHIDLSAANEEERTPLVAPTAERMDRQTTQANHLSRSARVAARPLPTSTLSTRCAPAAFKCGAFTVALKKEGNKPYIQISHPDNPFGTPLLSTPRGKAFIKMGSHQLDISDQRGSYNIKQKITKETFFQTIDSIEQTEDGSIMISGNVRTASEPESNSSTFTWQLTPKGEKELAMTIEHSEGDFTEFEFDSNAQEKLFGFGEQLSHIDLKGQKVPILVQEQGIGRGHPIVTPMVNLVSSGSGGTSTSTNYPLPHFFSNQHRAFSLSNQVYSEFDLTASDRVSVKLFDKTLKATLSTFNDPIEHLKAYTEETGRMNEPPQWVHEGAILGVQGGEEKVLDTVKRCKAYGIPISGVWIQDWVGRRQTAVGSQLWWDWKPDPTLYPNWENVIQTLKDDGVRVLSYINPMLVDRPSDTQSSSNSQQEENFFQQAKRLGFLLKERNGEPYMVQNTTFSAGLIDLANPEAREWYKGIIKSQLIDKGVSGWMADYGESFPFDAALDSSLDPSEQHNTYPELWARANHEAILESGKEGEILVFTRCGHIKSPESTTMLWEGDQLTSNSHHDGLESSITGLVSGGLSGITNNHSDVGGYTSISVNTPLGAIGIKREPWLLHKWLETNAFTGLLRTHEGLQPKNNAQVYDQEMLPAFKQAAKIFASLKEYRSKLYKEAHETGTPVVRHPMLHYFDDPEAHDLRKQFMLGPDLMVAPTTGYTQTETDVYLPQEEWVHLWTGDIYDCREEGRSITVNAPKGKPAVFYKRGSIEGEKLRREFGLL